MTTPPKPQAGEMPDEIWVSPKLYPNDFGNEWTEKQCIGQYKYTRTALMVERLEKMKRKPLTEVEMLSDYYPPEEDRYSQGWNDCLDAIRDSMIKEAGRENTK